MLVARSRPPQVPPWRGSPCVRRPAHLPRRSRTLKRPASSAAADVLLVDSQNVLSRCRPPADAARLPGDGVAPAFADWLQFLAALAGRPQLVAAVFDAPRSKRAPQQQREQLAHEYLQRRQRRRGEPAQPPAGGDPLRPFKQRVQALGGMCLEAAPRWEADDGLAAVAAAVQQRWPSARLLVASGDGDMQQLLAPRTAWLQLHVQTSLQHPLAAELVTAAAFERQHGFPPAAYPDWLALAGKREASIRGADVGSRTAARLLARYGSLEAVLAAAAAGQLKGWGPAVQRLLEGGGGGGGGDWQARLCRNRLLFAANAEPAVVGAPSMALLLQQLERPQPPAAQPWDSSGAGSSKSLVPTAGLAWLHPLHARRWRCLQQLAQPGGPGGRIPWQPQQAATPQGLALDGIEEGAPGTATFYICPADVKAGAWPKALAAAHQQREATGADQSQQLTPLLHGGMRHHVRLVQRAGWRVQLRLPPVEPSSLAAAAGAAAQSAR